MLEHYESGSTVTAQHTRKLQSTGDMKVCQENKAFGILEFSHFALPSDTIIHVLIW